MSDEQLLTYDSTMLLEAIELLGDRIERVHTLVNSNLTASIRGELDATVREVAMMREVMALNKTAGRDPSEEAHNAITAADLRVAELRATMADRAKATEIAEAQVVD